jgi:hypothetical protein
MKRMMGTVLIAGFLVVTADLEAAQRRFDRVKSMDGPKPEVALTNGLQLVAASDFGSPPPAPAENPVFQAPANDTVSQPPVNDAAQGAPANDTVLGAPASGPVLVRPPGDAVSVPPAPLPPVGLPGSPSALPLPEATPGFVAAGSPPMQLAPAPPLFRKVKYIDRRHIAPGAVHMYVAVRDPRERHERGLSGPPKCVLVEICVPPYGMPKITSRHDGTRVRYDYGQYAVNITSRHGVVVVNYDR